MNITLKEKVRKKWKLKGDKGKYLDFFHTFHSNEGNLVKFEIKKITMRGDTKKYFVYCINIFTFECAKRIYIGHLNTKYIPT